jgi:hypothetical protein
MAFTPNDLERYLQQIEEIAWEQDANKRNDVIGETGKTLKQLLQEEFIETDIKVYATYNYDLLQALSGNRRVTKSHVKKIVNNILTKWYKFQVGQINKHAKVIDMQHRSEALKEIKETHGVALPAFVAVVPNATRADVTALNAVSKNRSSQDHLWAWTTSDDAETRENYARIEAFINEFKLPTDLIIGWIGAGEWYGKDLKEVFMAWQLLFPKGKELKLRQLIEKIMWIHERVQGKKNPTTKFLQACRNLVMQPWFDFKIMQKKFESDNPYLEELQNKSWFVSQSAIFEILAKAYNYRMKNDKNRIGEVTGNKK